jgi:membrane associated rhomboid family serine protease
MIPVSDEPRTRIFPFVNVSIIVACVAVFVYELTLSEADLNQFFFDYGVVPAELVDWLENPSGWEQPLTVVTSAFVHGGFLHLLGNMVFLWVFGDNIEDALGHVLYVLFYLACAVGAVALQVAVDTEQVIPMVGASGAISGVMGGYFILHPTARIDALFVFFILPVPAFVLIGFWVGLQVLVGVASIGSDATQNVAVWAHIGGFVTGLGLMLVARPFIRIRPVGRRGAAGW